MATKQKNIKPLFDQLKTEWKKPDGSKNVEILQDLTEKLKVEFLSSAFLPTTGQEGNLDILVMQRDTLEIAVLIAVMKRDKEEFKSAMSQLKYYYNEVSKLNKTPQLESGMKNQMLGLNLMYLLADSKLAEFHMELERVPAQAITDDVFISTPVKLEQYLMEGCYNKIFLSKSNVPSPYYVYFIEILLDTVRDEIAICIAKAYDKLNVTEAARLLFFDSKAAPQDVLKYAEKKKWQVSNDKSRFEFVSVADKQKKEEEENINTERLVSQHIFYAKQLEMIV